MPTPPSTGTAIRRGLAFLAKTQEDDGSFVSYSSASMRPFRRLRSWRTVFVPALMLNSLAGLNEPTALLIREKLASFLLDQKENNWSYNYWAKSAPEHTSQPYPDDLDDTFCALAGLYRHDPSLIDAAALAKIVKLLLATEASVGGPYRTWLVPAGSDAVWLDVDIAVNSNIAYFLSMVGNRLPRLNDLIGQAIAKDSFSSPYYPSRYAFVYYFARSYSGPERTRLLDKVRQLHKAAMTDLDRALCLSARLQLGDAQDTSEQVNKLLETQRRDGSWPAAGFYADPVKNGRLYYNGAAALTTAFVIEALGNYERIRSKVDGKTPVRKEDKTKQAVLALAKKRCRTLDKQSRSTTLKALEITAAGNNGLEIIDLARRFGESLLKPGKLPDGFTEELGLANLFGWTAYTIYDDFLDGEGKPELIPVANIALRRSLDGFSEALPDDRDFKSFVRQAFDTIDNANAWELANCRFTIDGGRLTVGGLPDYGDLAKLAERSVGHALPPLAVLAAKGSGPGSAAFRQTFQAIKHYLIARQLNDDAHDWPEDLRNGHITPVLAMLLKELELKPGKHDLTELLPPARRRFWHTVLPEICRQMERHVRLSRQALARSGLFRPDNVLSSLLDGIEISIEDTLAQQSQAKEFLAQYKHKSSGAAGS